MKIKTYLAGAALAVGLSSAALAADNTTINAGAGGDTIRTVDKTGEKAQVVVIDVAGSGTENVNAMCMIEDVAETVAGNLFAAGTVRRDTAASSAGTSGDNATLNTDADGRLWVGGTGVEDVAETAAGNLNMCGTVRRDTQASSAGTTGDNATLNTDATGNLWVVGAVLEDAAETAANPLLGVGAVRRDTAASSAGTTGDNATLNTDDLGKLWVTGGGIEDVAETAATSLSMAGSVRRDTAASSAGTTGDNATINTDATGNLWVTGTVLEDVAETAGGTMGIAGTVRRDTKASSAGTTGDNATLNTDANGGLWLAADIIEDVTETAAAPLVGVGAVRRDTAASSAGTTGDNATINTDATGHLWVMPNILTVAGTTAVVEDAAETAAGNLVPLGAVRRDTKASSGGTTGDNVTINTDANGGLWMAADVIEDVAETVAAPLVGVAAVRRDTAASSAGTTGDNATINTDATGHLWVMPNILTVAGSTAVVEDAAETAAGNLVPLGAVRRDTAASSGGTTGDNVTVNTDATGHVWVMPNILTVAGSTAVVEDAAETAAGNLLPLGAVRRDTKASSGGTTGDNVTINTDANGGLWLAADVIEDVAETAAAPLVGVGAVRRDTQASSAGTTGDNATINVDNLGSLYVNSTGHQATASGIITVTTAGTSIQGASVTTKECWFQTAAGATGTNCFLGAATGDNRNKGLMLIKGTVSVGPIKIQNLNLVWADCATSGDTVQYFCTN